MDEDFVVLKKLLALTIVETGIFGDFGVLIQSRKRNPFLNISSVEKNSY